MELASDWRQASDEDIRTDPADNGSNWFFQGAADTSQAGTPAHTAHCG
jgi:hypothetical protein